MSTCSKYLKGLNHLYDTHTHFPVIAVTSLAATDSNILARECNPLRKKKRIEGKIYFTTDNLLYDRQFICSG